MVGKPTGNRVENRKLDGYAFLASYEYYRQIFLGSRNGEVMCNEISALHYGSFAACCYTLLVYTRKAAHTPTHENKKVIALRSR